MKRNNIVIVFLLLSALHETSWETVKKFAAYGSILSIVKVIFE